MKNLLFGKTSTLLTGQFSSYDNKPNLQSRSWLRIVEFLCLSFFITACGAGGGSNDSTATNDPGPNAPDISEIADINSLDNVVANTASIGTPVGYTAFAIDNDLAGNTVSYNLEMDGGGLFSIDPTSGVVSVAAALTGLSYPASIDLEVKASSTDGSSTLVEISVTIVESSFVISATTDSNALANSVAANASIGDRVGISAYAVDMDTTTNTVSYSLSDDAGGLFAIDSRNGIVTVADTLNVNDSPYTVSAESRSLDASSSSNDFLITVTAANGPDLTLQFPARQSITDTASINLRGLAASNPSSVTNLASVMVDNAGAITLATLNAGNRWNASGIAINPGINSLTITATDSSGMATTLTATVNRVDFSGVVTQGIGPILSNPLWLEFDELKNTLYITDDFSDEVFEVDPQTGNRTVLASIRPTAADITPAGIAIDRDNNRLLIADSGTDDQLIAVSLINSSATVVSDDSSGTPTFSAPMGHIEVQGDTQLIIDQTRRRFYSIDASGARTTLIDFDGVLSYFVNADDPNSFALDNNNRAIVVVGSNSAATLDAVLAYDITNNTTVPLATLASNADLGAIGSGIELTHPTSVEFDPVLNRALISDADLDAIIELNLDTLVRSEVSGAARGLGNHLSDIAAGAGNVLRYDAANNVGYAISFGFSELVMIDIETGDQVILSK